MLTYKRGEGWVEETVPEHETLTDVVGGKYRVTLVRRQPEVGECYWTDRGSLRQTMDILLMNVRWFDEDTFVTRKNYDGYMWREATRTMLVERLP